jgi:hypothetical protein
MPWLQAALAHVTRQVNEASPLPIVEQAAPAGEQNGVMVEKDPMTGLDIVRELFLEQVEERLRTW